MEFLVLLSLCVAVLGSSAQPPCYNPLNPKYETLCYAVVETDGVNSVRDYGVGVEATLATGFTAATNFSLATFGSAEGLFDYFLGDNLSVKRIPLTVPLIFRPTPAGTWSSSMVLATSAVPTKKDAPAPFPPTNVMVDAFGTHRIAAHSFTTPGLAVPSDYKTGCAALTRYLAKQGLVPAASGDWAEAWVTYSPLSGSQPGEYVNECWMELAPVPPPPVYTSPPCYNPLNPNFESVCYTTIATADDGLLTVRELGTNVAATIATAYSNSTIFTNGTFFAAYDIFSYFGRDNDKVEPIPTTVPLIYRPTPAGTWSTSMVLATSVIPSPAAAPGVPAQLNMDVEAFGQHKIAALTFYTIYPATAAEYQAACSRLSAYIASKGLRPVPGDWAEAWVTYSTQQRIGNRINECWIEVA